VSAFKRNLVPLVCIAFVAASVATAIFYGLLGSRLRSADTPRQSIVVAARGLERGAIVTAADVKLSTWGGQYPLKGGYSAIDQVTGKSVSSAVQENEPVTQARLGSGAGSAGIGIASGMRAISVYASDSSGVLALLRPGDKVDVQVVTGERNGEVKLRTTLEKVEVLSVPPLIRMEGAPRRPRSPYWRHRRTPTIWPWRIRARAYACCCGIQSTKTGIHGPASAWRAFLRIGRRPRVGFPVERIKSPFCR
jgi:Flp pilus assembly protein CpaB